MLRPEIGDGFFPTQLAGDHYAVCRQWRDAGLHAFNSYWSQKKHEKLAKDIETEARSVGWNDYSVQQLLRIVAEAQGTGWKDVPSQAFGTRVYEACLVGWETSSTEEQRTAEAEERARRKIEAEETRERALAQMERAEVCSNYANVARQLIIFKKMTVPPWTYRRAALWAASQAYGPNGEMYMHSEADGDALMALAAAAYFAPGRYGDNPHAFSEYARRECMNGHLLDASSSDPVATEAPQGRR